MASKSSTIDFGVAVTSPGYKLVAADGTKGSQITTGMVTITGGQGYFIENQDVGSAARIEWLGTYSGTVLVVPTNFDPPTTAASAAPTVAEIDTQLSGTHGAGSWESSGAGSGAYAITPHVEDALGNNLQNALVRVTEGINTFTTTTNASGNGSPAFSLDAATYTVTVTKGGYTFSTTTRTVTGNEAGTLTADLVMTAVVIPAPPADPTKGTVYGNLTITNGGSLLGKTVRASLKGSGPYYWNGSLIAAPVTTTTAADGSWALEVPGTDDITPAGAQWHFQQKDSGLNVTGPVISGTSVSVTTFD